MANFKRRKPRASPSKGKGRGHWLAHWPRIWDILQHTRPSRRRNNRVVSAIMRGEVDADEAVLPAIGHKPHNYYW